MLASLITRAEGLLSFAKRVAWLAAAAVLYSAAALAQQAQPQAPQPQPQPQPQAPQPQAPQPQAQAPQQQGPAWAKMPRMQLEQQYAGPLQDTILQRWRDPQSGFTCYMYLPIVVAHTTPTETGYVQYGPNTIGSVSCVQPVVAPAAKSSPAPAKRAAPPPAPSSEPKP